MKKLLLIILSLFLISGCTDTRMKEVSYKDFINMTKNKETFILYIGQAGCSACQSYTPIFKEVLEDYNLKAYYIDLKVLNSDEYNNFTSIINVNSTPTIVFIKNGEETSALYRINGATSYEKTVAKMQNQGYIK